MAQLTFVLSALSVLIAVIGFVYTVRLGRQQRWQGELDGPVPKTVQEHAYMRNPMLLAYVLAALLAIFAIGYLALRYY
ncbi:hypothetical protein P9199_12215 [Geobacillus stearothermophilus]|uniref:hypothetical protein n=1 Tax=Geobacillus stearothermophilus TaxID=1422 RepID=UPI000B927C9A|nr:hypothetical protein [Geobacillus stearothermophilus]ASS88304.1 hypothetical protein GLN3_15580 [Geobacillus lituanicus]MED4877878.1 hypothetical protein [Anoxybacillus geothermalis]ATA59367.1 hypothetical protein GS458_0911 [Geobacillus stearothermophilus]MED4270908.1 hypothetical protein [Geobacillus stearothermophilus]MED4301678.1 hypothetical protein [Geobacillus stearothermophilus]